MSYSSPRMNSNGQLSIGDDIGEFRVQACLEFSSYGALYKVRKRELDEVRFLFVFPRFTDQECRQRVLDVVRVLGRFKGPGLLPLGDCFLDEEVQYVVSAPLRNPSLEEGLKARGNKFDSAETRRILESLTKVLVGFHAQGLVHGVLTPAKICWSEDLGVEVFGLGWGPALRRMLDPVLPKSGESRAASASGVFGQVDFLIDGNSRFCSPEWLQGGEVDARADYFSLGHLGFYLLTGTLEGLKAGVSSRVAGTHSGWDKLLRLCTEKEAGRRPQSSEQLQALVTGLSVKASHTKLYVFAAAGLLLIAGAAVAAVYLVPSQKTIAQAPATPWYIETSVPGAEIVIDGVSRGHSPLSLDSYAIGTLHKIQAKAPGYDTLEVDYVFSEETAQLKLNLQKSPVVVAPPVVETPVAPPAPVEPESLSLPLSAGVEIPFTRVAPGQLSVGSEASGFVSFGISQTLYVAQTELTQQQLAALASGVDNNANLQWRYNSSTASAKFAEYPAQRISYQDVRKILKKVSSLLETKGLSEYTVDLLNENEWEYLARDGDTAEQVDAAFLSRNALIDKNAPAPVRSLPANKHGLFGMLGNVSEWVHSSENIRHDLNTDKAVVKGGYWSGSVASSQPGLRKVYSTQTSQSAQFERCGIRLVLRKK